MSRSERVTAMLGAVLVFVLAVATGAQQPQADGPTYQDGTSLVLPADYRSCPFIGAGLGMSYVEGGGTPESENPLFSHAFVNPSSHRSFMDTGTWPDGTVFMLEFRRSASEGSINVSGRFATDLVFLEAEVKDSRFPDGWAYFNFGPGDGLREATPPLTGDAVSACVECHSESGAVERTFVQFYPTLLDVAREKGTLRPGFSRD